MKYSAIENVDDYMASDEVAALLVKLYAIYYNDVSNSAYSFPKEEANKYAKAVGIAIRMLGD